MQAFLQSIRNFKLLFLLLPVIYFVLYGFQGYDDTDRGFVVSMAYRVETGDMPYRDFIYVRPPATPFLHSLELMALPDSLEMIGMRFGFYLFAWLAILFGLLALRRFFDFEKLGISPWLLGILAFIFSMHNYPAMAWHTMDGILFGALGIWLISRGKEWYHLVPGLVALGLSAAAKQSFGLMPFAGVVLILVLYDWRRALLSALGAGGLAAAVLAALELAGPFNLIATMKAQMTASSSFNELRYGAYQLYVRPTLYFCVPLLALWAVLRHVVRLPRTGMVMSWAIWATLAAVLAINVYLTQQAGTFMPPRGGIWFAMLAAAGALAVYGFFRLERKGMALFFVLVLLNWSSGISWGYVIPILFSLPSLFGLVYLIGDRLDYRPPSWFWPALTAIAFGTYFYMYGYPFRDAHRSELTYDLGEVFPRLSHIRSSQAHYESLSEFKRLQAKHGDHFTVLPAMPQAHYLTKTKPPIPVDWAHDAEIGYGYGVDSLIGMMERKRPVVFVEKLREDEAYKDRHFECSLLRYVLENWEKKEEGDWYKVYVANDR